MVKPLRSDNPAPQNIQFTHFGILNDGSQSRGSLYSSVVINVLIAIIIIIIGAAVHNTVVPPQEKVVTLIEPLPVKPPPLPPTPKVTPRPEPKPPVVQPEPPKIKVPEVKVPEPKVPPVRVTHPAPVVVPATAFVPCVPLTAPPGEVFGKIMSVPDRLVDPYFRALSEWQDPELAVLRSRLDRRSLRPVDAKKLLAGEVTAAIHGVEAATRARADFTARFSKRSFHDVSDLPSAPAGQASLAETVRSLGFAKSNGEVRRLAEQKGIRIVVEQDDAQTEFPLSAEEIHESVAALVKEHTGDLYLKVGRKLARLVGTTSA